MNIIDVTLSKLALASCMFDALMPYNKSYQRFNKRVSTHPDLLNESHRKALIEWLNDWGCRHLSKNQHETTSTHILTWFNNNQPQLASISNPVWDLSEKELQIASHIYGALKDELAGERVRQGVKQVQHIGPTAASKILFALKPDTLMPWDDTMRLEFQCSGDAESYRKYLNEMKALSQHIEKLCEEKGFSLKDLPEKINRPNATIIAILNDYVWVTATREVDLPSKEVFAVWASWD
ncbi:hypothetical protein ACFLVX_01965, partial [Chloroflexota bacterium]